MICLRVLANTIRPSVLININVTFFWINVIIIVRPFWSLKIIILMELHTFPMTTNEGHTWVHDGLAYCFRGHSMTFFHFSCPKSWHVHIATSCGINQNRSHRRPFAIAAQRTFPRPERGGDSEGLRGFPPGHKPCVVLVAGVHIKKLSPTI